MRESKGRRDVEGEGGKRLVLMVVLIELLSDEQRGGNSPSFILCRLWIQSMAKQGEVWQSKVK